MQSAAAAHDQARADSAAASLTVTSVHTVVASDGGRSFDVSRVLQILHASSNATRCAACALERHAALRWGLAARP